MNYKAEYERWLQQATDEEITGELKNMNEAAVEDAFYRELAFGTGGLRGVIGAGTNRMNVYVVAKASQGLASYLGQGTSVVIGYDSRIKSDVFAREAACVCAGNHDITDVLVDATLRIGGRDYNALAKFLEQVYELSEVHETAFVFTVSADKEELPESIFNFCKVL